MPTRTRGRILTAAFLTAILSAPALPAQAAPPETFPAGLACDFEMEMAVIPGGHIVNREFRDADGNVVRVLQAGRGEALTFTNLETGAEASSRSSGFAIQTKFNPDGTVTVTMSGNTLLIMFPTDIPAGPTTTIHTGRVTFDVSTEGVFTLAKSSGRTRDICAELG